MTLARKSLHVLQTAFEVENKANRMKINFLSANIKKFIDVFRGPFPYVIVLEKEGPNYQLN